MEPPRFPLLYSLLTVHGDIVLNSLLLHERGKNSLIDRIICDAGVRYMGKEQGGLHTIDDEHTDRWYDFLILGTLL